ncbi:MAG: hypothetical protein ACFFBR_06020 [Promethearchaeota archaeon]
MGQSKPTSGMRATLLFLLYPLVGELLFIDTVIKDVYTRRRIRAVFTLMGLATVAISFAASELILYIADISFSHPILTIPVRYIIAGSMGLLFLVMFLDEGRRGRISLKEQIDVPEDRISLLIDDSRDIFITLNRILNAAQLRRHNCPQCENSRLASYALTVLGEYLQARVFTDTSDET